jgi:methionyl-tRNA formyltransferase
MKMVLLGSGELAARCVRTISSQHEILGVHFDANNPHNMPLRHVCTEVGTCHLVTQEQVWSQQADAFLLISFPYLIPARHLPGRLVINVHNSLLPKYRGLYAFVWALLNDENEVGYSVHQGSDGIDDGPIFYQARKPVSDADTVNDLLAWMAVHLPANLPAVLTEIANGSRQAVPQNPEQATYVTRRRADGGQIDWRWPARRLFNLVRALAPPYTLGAFCTYRGEHLFMTRATYQPSPAYFHTEGRVVALHGDSVLVKCGDSVLQIDEVSWQGQRLPAAQLIGKVGLR